MRTAFANARYRSSDTRGANAHIAQFIHQSACLGHGVWLWPGNTHPDAHTLPAGRTRLHLALRQMDVLYTRLQEEPPLACRYALAPWKRLIGSPLIVWEFNTAPEFHRVMGRPEARVRAAVEAFRHFGTGCDLAVCVSESLHEYVRQNLGLRRIITVPNGSDPDLFRPDTAPVPGRQLDPAALQVAWLGSGELAWHNLELLEQTAARLNEMGTDRAIQFHVIGNAASPAGQTWPNLHYHGPVPYADLPGWLAGMDVGLCLYHPGPAEYSSPLKLFDYMASGLAVVSLYQPQVKEILEQLEQLDQLVPASDPQLLAEVLLGLCGDREGTRRRGLAGRQLLIRQYTWRRAAETIYGEIQFLLDQRRH